jgi:steroid delta-isomerase-like uncharacterized protein
MSTEENKKAVRRWVEAAWNNGDQSELEALYSPEFVIHFGSTVMRGPSGLAEVQRIYRTAFPDIHFDIEDLIAAGDRVCWRITVTGTHRGEFMGIPASNKAVNVKCIVVSRFEGDKWVEDYVSNDDLGLLQQIGAVPAA